MRVTWMKKGFVVKNENTESKVLKTKEYDLYFDVTATKRIFELCSKYSDDFLETGVDAKDGYFWIVRNTGDNFIKVYPKEGSKFVTFPRFNWNGEITNMDSIKELN